MKMQLIRLVAMAIMLSVSGVLVSAMSFRAASTLTFRVKVPFEFQIGEDKFPAGEYQFKHLEENVLTVRGIKNDASGLVLGGTAAEIADAYDEYKLTFNSYGEKNFLRAVSSPSSTFHIGESEAEKRSGDSSAVIPTKLVIKY